MLFASLTHLFVLGEGLLGLGELVALRLLGHGVVVVGSHGAGGIEVCGRKQKRQRDWRRERLSN